MKVLLLTKESRKMATARNLVYRMHPLLIEKGIDASVNSHEYENYDVVLIDDTVGDTKQTYIEESVRRYPTAHIGILAPTYKMIDEPVANIDFFVVQGFQYRELLLPWRKRIYVVPNNDHEDPEGKALKQHEKTSGLVLGYHGNEVHYGREFFPNLAHALQELATEHQFTLKVVINNANAQPRIQGVDTEFIEWDLDTYDQELETFDIGLCPSFSTFQDMAEASVYVRNGNRAYTLLFKGIPSVTSPLPELCQALTNDVSTIFAVSEYGWYDALERLITQPELRNRIGHAGRQVVEEKFSSEVAVNRIIDILNAELKEPLFPKLALQPESDRPAFLSSKIQARRTRLGRRQLLDKGSRLRKPSGMMTNLRRRFGSTRLWGWLRTIRRGIGYATRPTR